MAPDQYSIWPSITNGSPLSQKLSAELQPHDQWGEFRPGARPAAVTLLLNLSQGRLTFPLVRHRPDARDHPGQIGLPGGGVKPGEEAWQAALREIEEELGVPAASVVPIGAGPVTYTAVSNYCLASFVAALPGPDPTFEPDLDELDGLIEMPLETALDPASWQVNSERPWMGPFLVHGDVVVWGLTSRVLRGLLPAIARGLGREARIPGV